jgi:hypothetical protein
MSQRISGYDRRDHDDYPTPAWVTKALLPHLPPEDYRVWEPAAGSGEMVKALVEHGLFVCVATDIATGRDFLVSPPPSSFRGIVTNPPYRLATEFIERALSLIPANGFVAMLLRADFDSAKTRRHLFADCRIFAKKIVLTKRIRWIVGSTGSPSFNHAWFMWDRAHRGPAILAYDAAGRMLSISAAGAVATCGARTNERCRP